MSLENLSIGFLKKSVEGLMKHQMTTFTANEIRSPFFEDLKEINGAFKMKERKRQVNIMRPYQCSIAVYQLAKLRMLEFYNDFLDYYFEKRDFELLQMGIDLFYIAWSGENIDDLVKPEL